MANKVPVQIQAKVTPINVPVYQLPEFLCVETQVVTKKFAAENNISNLPVLNKDVLQTFDEIDTDESVSIVEPNSETKSQEAAPVPPAKPILKALSISTNTLDLEIPQRDRLVQTDTARSIDMGIQCNMDDVEFDRICTERVADSEQFIQEEGRFLCYVSEHTNVFPNGMLECLVCGEIAVALQEHQNHMLFHYGPRVLCAKCGTMINHELLLKQHAYVCSARGKLKSSMHFKCPHFSCNVAARSRHELSNHINKHFGVYYYRCSKCKQKFTTTERFLVHRITEESCRKAKPIYLSRRRAQSTRKSDLTRCTICLKSFSNKRVCAKHSILCMRALHIRLKRNLMKKIR